MICTFRFQKSCFSSAIFTIKILSNTLMYFFSFFPIFFISIIFVIAYSCYDWDAYNLSRYHGNDAMRGTRYYIPFVSKLSFAVEAEYDKEKDEEKKRKCTKGKIWRLSQRLNLTNMTDTIRKCFFIRFVISACCG